jgi:hypothetical protein
MANALGALEYVAVRRETGEVQFLGMLGEVVCSVLKVTNPA